MSDVLVIGGGNAALCAALTAREAGKPVTVCGEMASDPQALPVFLALGITHLSIAPASADGLREAVRILDVKECRLLLGNIGFLHTAEQVKEAIHAFLAASRAATFPAPGSIKFAPGAA